MQHERRSAKLGKEGEPRASVGASNSQPESLTGFVVGGFNKNCRRLLDLIMMDLGHSFKNPATKHRQPCGSMKIGALAAAHVEWRKYHHASHRRQGTFVPTAAIVLAFAIILAGVAGCLP